MSYDGNGNHSLPDGTIVNTGDKILPSQHNPAMQDISASLSSVLVRDGRAGMVGNLPMGGFKTVNMGDGTDPTDGATVGQLGTTFGAQVGAATSKATPVDADYLPLYDSAAANALRNLTWANVKATLKAYFDTLYQATGTALLKSGGTMTGDLILKGNPTSNLMAATKQYVDSTGVFTKSYESPEQTIAVAGTRTITHGMGGKPKITTAILICKTAETISGTAFSVGDEIAYWPGFHTDSGNSRGASIKVNSTQFVIQYSNQAGNTFQVISASGGIITLTNDNWRLIVRAYA
jgi:hypothetical protein